MSLIELKKLAKEKRIKQYYILKRQQLIELLDLPSLPFSYTLEKMTIKELRQIAKDRCMRGFWTLSKQELIDQLFPSHDKKEYDGKTGKHQNPQDKNAYEVGV